MKAIAEQLKQLKHDIFINFIIYYLIIIEIKMVFLYAHALKLFYSEKL